MIKAKSIMTENAVTVNEGTTLEEAAKIMLNKHVNSLIVQKQNKPIAIINENNIIEGSIGQSIKKAKVKGSMSKKFLLVGPETSYSFIIRKLKEEGIKRFPVIENDKVIGIITETDIVDATRDFTRFHQIMQEVILAVFGIFTAFFLFFFSPLGQSIFG